MGRGQEEVRGPGQLEGLVLQEDGREEEDEGMGEELEPEAWRQDRACWWRKSSQAFSLSSPLSVPFFEGKLYSQ